jgi:hypothetical protein
MADILNQYEVAPTDALSASNIESTVTAPVAKPDLSDPFGIQSYYENFYGTPALQSALVAANKSLTDFDLNAATFQNQLEDSQVGMNVIRGMQDKAARKAALDRTGLVNTVATSQAALDTMLNKVNQGVATAKEVRTQLSGLIATAPGAGIAYTDTYEVAAKKAEDYLKKEAEEQAKDEYKQKLKEMALSLGLKTKGSTKELEKRIGKYNKEDLALAKKVKETSIKESEANIKKKLSGGGLSDSEINTANENDVYSVLSSLKSAEASRQDEYWDGYLNPNDWKPVLQKWIEANGSAMTFLDKFKQFINPSDV